ncbi:MAG: DUF434 domain-containing protein [Planctomycetaceae bacterium]|nr:DUF434 domain-containing protein [Planctomycetaceae bacterium]
MLFAPVAVGRLRAAASDLAWLLDRGYAPTSSFKLVGDRYQLAARQRTAVARCVCSAEQAANRQARRVELQTVKGRTLWLDGYNVLTTVEAALAGAVLLAASDGTLRDMASMHGSYRKVAETRPALGHIGEVIEQLAPSQVRWLLDRPVSNSGRLKQIIEEVAAEHGWPWTAELVADPDPLLAGATEIVATADSAILDRCGRWLNLVRLVIEGRVPDAHILDLQPHG